MAIQSNFPAIRPTLDLNFAGSRTVDPRITFTRASTATYFDELGVMRTAPANTPRIDFDPVTLECKGLLIEEQRTNLLLNSDTLATQNVTVTAVQHTLTFYGTGTITLSGAAAGNLVGTGVSNRVRLTFTPTAGTLTITVSGTCNQAQLEIGTFPTSHIQTTTAQVTRAADIASIALPSWYNQFSGTIFADASGAKTKFIVCIDDGTSANRLQLATGANAAFEAYSVTAGVTTNFFSGASVPSAEFERAKISAAFKSGSSQVSINGQLPFGSSPATGSTPSSLTSLRIGSNWAGGNLLCGHIRRLAYYPRIFENANLQAITS